MISEVKLSIPESCECGYHNFKVFALRIDGDMTVEIRCLWCGKRYDEGNVTVSNIEGNGYSC